MDILYGVFVAATILCAAIVSYQLVFAIAALAAKPPTKGTQDKHFAHFAILIPAHNEQEVIGCLLASLRDLRYSGEYEVYVIVDNCSDDTETIVREHGFHALVRTDEQNRGKGHALNWAITTLQRTDKWQSFAAIVIIDADSMVNSEYLQALDRQLQNGAKAIQSRNGVLNERDSWIAMLMHLSDILQYEFYFAGREKLGLGVRLLGNGMCFQRDIIDRFGWNTFTVAEDFEYHLNLVEAGYRTHYEADAICNSQQVTSLKQGKSQRSRWISGYYQLCYRKLPQVLREALRHRSLRRVEAVVDFIMPTLSMQGLLFMLTGVLAIATHSLINFAIFATIAAPWLALILMGISKSGIGWQLLPYLPWIPIYIGWKVILKISLPFTKIVYWKRTERQQQ